jgi:hypothetical protein
MDGKKPLIFFEPMSDTLKKLYEVIEPNAEDEGIEIYVVEDISEMTQLIPTIGQALVLASSPKKCAMMMQQNRRAIKKIKTKIILLSPKTIPRKILEKFMKLGLTECVVEPVNPKTLLYKVRLFLRSIVTKKEEAGFNDKTDVSSDSMNSQNQGGGSKRFKKDQENEEESNSDVKEKKKREEVTMEDYSKGIKKDKSEEEPIDNYYRGEMKKKEEVELEEEEEKPKKAYQEEAIDTNYKGNISTEELDIEEDEVGKVDMPDFGDRERDELEDLRHSMALEVEDDLGKRKESEFDDSQIDSHMKGKLSTDQLDVEDDEPKTKERENSDEEIDNYMRGESSSASLNVEDDEKSATQERENSVDRGGHYKGEISQGLDIEDDASEKEIRLEEEKEEEIDKKKKPKLDLVDDENIYNRELSEEEKEKQERDRKAALDLIDEMEDFKKKQELDIIEDEPEDKKRDAKADQIDGYMRGGAAKKDLDLMEDDEDIYARDEKEQQEHSEKEKTAKLDLIDDAEEKEKKDTAEEDQNLDDLFKRAERLAVVDDDPREREKAEREEEDDRERRKSNFQEEEQGNMRGKAGETEKFEDGYNKSNNKAEHIQTHYSSKESVRHDEKYDWDVQWEKQDKEKEDDKGPQEEKSLIFEQEDLGEQTINYKKLKDEFDGITIDREAEGEKKIQTEFSEIAEVKTFTKTVLDENLQEVEMEFEDVVIEEDLEEPEQKVFEPKPAGIDICIRTLSLYMDKKTTLEQVNEFVASNIYQLYGGKTVFFKKNKDKKEDLDFVILQNGYITTPNEEALEGEALEEVTTKWNEIYTEHYKTWKEARLPVWSDETFQEKEIQFIFPYYEAGDCIGIGVVFFEDGFIQENTATVEMVMEVCRGVFLQELHKTEGEERVIDQKPKAGKKPGKKKKGFFGSLIDKIAG